MKRMLSAIKPTGQLTLGNYIGALKNFVSYQNDHEMICFIANLHCITVYQEPQELKKNLYQVPNPSETNLDDFFSNKMPELLQDALKREQNTTSQQTTQILNKIAAQNKARD